MTTSISDIRTVPVQEDLTTDDLRCSIIRGLETMSRVDKKLAPGVQLLSGQWGVLQPDGTISLPGSSSAASSYLVFLGTDRFDVKATGAVTVIMNSPIIVKSSTYNVMGSYSVGTYLTVKGGVVVTPAASGDFVVGKVTEIGQGYLVYEVVPVPFQVK